MGKTILKISVILLISMSLIFSMNTLVQAGNKNMTAGKREMFKDDSVATMQEVILEREKVGEVYKDKMLANSDEMIKLLNEIKVLIKKYLEEKGE